MVFETSTVPAHESAERRAFADAIWGFRSEILALWPEVLAARTSRVPGLAGAVTRLKLCVAAWARGRTPSFEGRLNRWELLVDESTVRAGILQMRAGNRFPLHDHPDSLSVSLVISGAVIIGGFDRPSDSGTGRAVQLPAVGRQLLKEGELSLVLPKHGNAHDLSALKDSTLLEVTVSRDPRGSKFWYFPLEGKSSGGSSLTAIAMMQEATLGC